MADDGEKDDDVKAELPAEAPADSGNDNGANGDRPLEYMRVWSTRDLVTVSMAMLRSDDPKHKKPLPAAITELLKRPSATLYPYTKGPDLTNDGMAYGDVVRVRLLQKGAGGEVPTPHLAIRTRSGLTTLRVDSPADGPPAAVAAANNGSAAPIVVPPPPAVPTIQQNPSAFHAQVAADQNPESDPE